eukprot:TRINITY_DN18713_c0_g1_i4.p1 TRINITY_DN18713_c0_g1~~TRINITY_DN18713_c0_g1_i4.p1  ORF type:complete len:161 (+),score=53.83 TRINITY_DN18713_c0_g1_i4:80-562(+)
MCIRDRDITVMLEQIALDEALLAELSLRAGEPGQEDELQSELTGLKDEKWRLEQCLQLESLKTVLEGAADSAEMEQTETDASTEQLMESMRQDELELDLVMAQLKTQLDEVRTNELSFREIKEELEREITEFHDLAVSEAAMQEEAGSPLTTKLDSPGAA